MLTLCDGKCCCISSRCPKKVDMFEKETLLNFERMRRCKIDRALNSEDKISSCAKTRELVQSLNFLTKDFILMCD